MQLNPSTDFYDTDEDENYDDENVDNDGGSSGIGFYSHRRDDSEQSGTVLRAESLALGETLDMGYDEDDEKFSSHKPKRNQTDFESGSGSRRSGHNDHNFQLKDFGREFLQKYAKPQKTPNNWEGSGSFANDDDNDEDEDDDDDDDYDYNDKNDGKTSNGHTLFQLKRKSNNRYFRKNTNDAIKIISTPLGKVGIVYQQTANDKKENNDDGLSLPPSRTSFTDFDSLSPDPSHNHRLASAHPKVTPVLTADGKVALLYRGDSETTKYEPIHNLTHKFNNNFDNKTSDSNNNSQVKLEKSNDENENHSSDNNEFYDDSVENEQIPNSGPAKESDAALTNATSAVSNPTGIGGIDSDKSHSLLPMINRPLSEVLGIKKNQFKQFRVKDMSSTTTTTTTMKALIPGDNVHHFLTKVNLADYPSSSSSSSSSSRSHDFDFSQDSTMLDERSRYNNERILSSQTQGTTNNGINGMALDSTSSMIATEDVLSKTEVVNLAIVPHFDEEFEQQQNLLNSHENRRHHHRQHRHKRIDEDLSAVHCIMQAMMCFAAISTVFGMLGTFFKQRILDQIRLMHW